MQEKRFPVGKIIYPRLSTKVVRERKFNHTYYTLLCYLELNVILFVVAFIRFSNALLVIRFQK